MQEAEIEHAAGKIALNASKLADELCLREEDRKVPTTGSRYCPVFYSNLALKSKTPTSRSAACVCMKLLLLLCTAVGVVIDVYKRAQL